MTRKLNTLDDLQNRLRLNPEFRKQERLLRPYYDLVLAIIRRRNELGMSQKDLAEKAGTFQSRISKIESAEHDIRLSTLTQIAEALETEVVIQLIPFAETDFIEDDRNYKKLFQTYFQISKGPEAYAEPDQNAFTFNVTPV